MSYVQVVDPAVQAEMPKPKGFVQAWELLALFGLLIVYLATMILVGDQGTFVINLAGPAAMGAILLAGGLPDILRDQNLVWTPLFWFRVATAAYFSFGNIITFFLNDYGKEEVAKFFAQYTDLVTKLNAVTTLGVLMVLGAAYVMDHVYPTQIQLELPASKGRSQIKSPRTLLQIGVVFLIVGSVVQYGLVLPNNLGIGGFVLPGAVSSLSLLADAGIYMIAVWAWNFRPSLLVVPFVLTLINVVLGLLEFAKAGVVAAMMVLALAWLSKGITLRRLVVTAGVVLLTFNSIIPFVNAGRIEMEQRYHSLEGAGIPERLEIASHYFEGPDSKVNTGGQGYRMEREQDDQPASLLRFSYVNCGTFALSLFDSGDPGGTLATLPAVFIPRALWPDKPSMTDIGLDFSYMATGIDTSASSPGWLAEAYWDYGWFGPAIMLIPLGIVLQLWSSFSLNVMRAGKWIYFPLCLLGMKMGTTVDGTIVSCVAGTAVLALAAYVAIRVVTEIYTRASAQMGPVANIKA